jgi:hypothetical protein
MVCKAWSEVVVKSVMLCYIEGNHARLFILRCCLRQQCRVDLEDALRSCSRPDAVPGRYVICGMSIKPDEGLL